MAFGRRHIITGIIGIVTISGAVLYWQYTKLMKYAIKFVNIKPNNISINSVNFDLFLNFTNNSMLKFDIISQEYKIYLNDIFITTVTNYDIQSILPNSVNPITVNVNFNPTQVISKFKGTAGNLLLNFQQNIIRVDANVKISIFGLKINIPFPYQTSIKQLLDTPKTTK